ncbi:hypothetical protein BLOT_015463 [Blomia tropicalis]|nr:hypothetical protein BLOT_015463 [Blomia tropicalis]
MSLKFGTCNFVETRFSTPWRVPTNYSFIFVLMDLPLKIDKLSDSFFHIFGLMDIFRYGGGRVKFRFNSNFNH